MSDDFWRKFDGRLARTAEVAARDGIAREGSLKVREYALALWHDREDDALRILRGGLDVSETYHYKRPAEWAAGLGKTAALASVLSIESSDDSLSDALRTAVTCGRRESVEYLLAHGAHVELGLVQSPLFVACEFGNPEMIRLLIQHGADVNQRNRFHETTPLMVAASYGGFVPGYPEALFAQTLIYATALPDFRGRRVETLAVAPDYLTVVEELVRHGADVSSRDENGLTALDYASGKRSAPRGFISEGHGSDPAIVEFLARRQKPGGCYIATAVYGSYDSPEVGVLRRFRDERLGLTSAGRLAIRIYYAVSPQLVRVIGQSPWFSISGRRILDKVISRLRAAGY